jgi:hypothetical protein
MFKSLGGNGGGGRGFSYRTRTSKSNLLYETRQQRLPCRLGWWLASFLSSLWKARFNRVHPVLQHKPTMAHRRHKEEEEDADVLKLGSGSSL